jgi:hypothetical protein
LPKTNVAVIGRKCIKIFGGPFFHFCFSGLPNLQRGYNFLICKKMAPPETSPLFAGKEAGARIGDLVRPRIPLEVPTEANQRWSLDFVHDQPSNSRRLKVLNIVDDYSRVCVGQVA